MYVFLVLDHGLPWLTIAIFHSSLQGISVDAVYVRHLIIFGFVLDDDVRFVLRCREDGIDVAVATPDMVQI